MEDKVFEVQQFATIDMRITGLIRPLLAAISVKKCANGEKKLIVCSLTSTINLSELH